jgi:hypothetical protein
MDRILSAAAAVPSVRSVGVTTLLPGTTSSGRMGLRAAGTADPTTFATARVVTEGYFETLGVPLVRGRLVGPQDRSGTPSVAVVNERFVQLHFPGRDGVGERFQLTYKPDGEIFDVIGVVKDERLGPIDSEPPEAYYVPWRQSISSDVPLALAVRTSRGGAAIPELRQAVMAVDGDLAIQSLQEMPAMLSDSPAVFGRRYPVWLLGVFASCATLLAAIGLFGVLSYVVGERTHELGIRMALGAGPGEVVRDVARRALPAVAGGLVVGVLGSALAGHALRGLLFEARGFDLSVLGPVVAAMIFTAVLALLGPARRAVAVNPAVALRAE